MHTPLLRAPFETSRLRVAPWSDWLRRPTRRAALERRLGEILAPSVLATLPDPLHLPDSPDAIARWIEARDAESDVGLVVRKPDQRIIGLLILAGDASAPENAIHMGYLLAQEAWGRGYATELVRGALAAGIAPPGTQVLAGVARTNAASARVLEKAGFALLSETADAGTLTFAMRLP